MEFATKLLNHKKNDKETAKKNDSYKYFISDNSLAIVG